MSVDQYAIVIRTISEDDELLFEARVREFPDLVVFEEDAPSAFAAARSLIEASIEMLSAENLQVPKPIDVAVEDFSGRVTLRMPKSLHRSMSTSADADAVSLNQYIVNVLAEHAGYLRGKHAGEGIWQTEKPVPRRQHLRLVEKAVPIDGNLKWARSL